MTDARLPARIGALLASPGRALADVDQEGGGVRDAVWVAVLTSVCLRLTDIARAFIGWEAAPLAVVRQVLMVLAQQLRWPVVMAVVASVVITVLAGRGRRDPTRDSDLGALCAVPFFVARVILVTFHLD